MTDTAELATAPQAHTHTEIEKPTGELAATDPNVLATMERVQIDSQISTAKRYPRNMALFHQRANEMVSIDEETAASCVYHRPVGKKDGKMQYAQGESVRLAEIVAATYQNLMVRAFITEVTPRHVKAAAIARDLETNFTAAAEVVESTVTKDGKPFSERMRVVVAKAAQSKAYRDAIFRVVPKSLCKPIRRLSEEVAAGDARTLADRREAVLQWAETIGVTPERIFAALGIDGIEGIGPSEMLTLTGLRTAIRDGEIGVDEAFPLPEGPAAPVAGNAGLKAQLGQRQHLQQHQQARPNDSGTGQASAGGGTEATGPAPSLKPCWKCKKPVEKRVRFEGHNLCQECATKAQQPAEPAPAPPESEPQPDPDYPPETQCYCECGAKPTYGQLVNTAEGLVCPKCSTIRWDFAPKPTNQAQSPADPLWQCNKGHGFPQSKILPTQLATNTPGKCPECQVPNINIFPQHNG